MRAVKLTNGIENNVRRTKAMFFLVLRYVYNKGYKNIFSEIRRKSLVSVF